MPADLPQLGFGLPVSGAWATPETIRHVARRAEALGYASLWTFQRVLTPVGSDLGPGHESVLDGVVALTLAAADTTRIGLGTATICAPYVPPAVLAKQLASLDVVCSGRLTVGVGMGWMPEEYETAGVPYERRGARMDEYLRCLTALWTEDPVEFAGEFYTVPRAHQRPRPLQRPHPPILYGAGAAPGYRRAGRLAQGWIGSSRTDHAEIADAVATVRGAAADPDAVRILLRLPREPEPGELAALGALGVTEAFIDLNLAADEVDLEHAERVLEAHAPSA